MATQKTKAELEQEVEELKAQLSAKEQTPADAGIADKPHTDPGEEIVQIMLPRGEGELKYNRVVTVNDDTVSIPRGRPYMVKRKFRDAIRNADRQMMVAADYEDRLTAVDEFGRMVNARDVYPKEI